MTEQILEKTKIYDSRLEKSLDFLWLEITNKCNLNCTHCYADSSPFDPLNNKMNYSDWVNTIKEGRYLGCKKVQFIGGEPTIHPNLLDMIKYSKEIGYEFTEVYTNGTTLTEKMFKTFKDYDVNLAFSLYSHNSKNHEKITLRKGSFQKTINNIKKSLEQGLKVRAGIVEMQENSGDIQQTVNRLKNIGVKNIRVDYIRGVGRGEEKNKKENSMEHLCGNCWKGKLVVDSNGEVFPCVFSREYKMGSIHEGLNNILQKEELYDFCMKVKEMAEARSSGICQPVYAPLCEPNCDPVCDPNRIMGAKNKEDCQPNYDQTCSPPPDSENLLSSRKRKNDCGPENDTNCGPPCDPGN